MNCGIQMIPHLWHLMRKIIQKSEIDGFRNEKHFSLAWRNEKWLGVIKTQVEQLSYSGNLEADFCRQSFQSELTRMSLIVQVRFAAGLEYLDVQLPRTISPGL